MIWKIEDPYYEIFQIIKNFKMTQDFVMIKFKINFENNIIIKKPLIFTFRSIIGKELKKISCLFKKRLSCEECIINQTCPYSFYFESPEFDRGNKKPHPYTLFIDFKKGIEINKVTMELVLIGDKAISYFPYLYFSIMKAGERGIFKERERFIIRDVICNGSSILISHDKLNMDFPYEKWTINEDTTSGKNKKIKIKFFSPVRIKKNGKITGNVDYLTFLNAIFRRMKLLSKFYGEKELENIDLSVIPPVMFENENFTRKDFNYYSSRQKRRILLIGYDGYIEVEKMFSPFEESLLKAAEIFSVGSNTTFGFGKVKVL